MKLIVESGATKSDWRILGTDGSSRRLLRPGMNVSTMPLDHVLSVLGSSLQECGEKEFDGAYFYMAGIVTPEVRSRLQEAVRSQVSCACIDIQNDLTGAARAVCGRSPGIAAILGTGSNTCFWDGERTIQKVRSGGFIIGDEGGGAALGRLFLSDFIKGLVPEPVASEFARRFDASYEGIVEGVYRSPAPAGYLGSIAPFLLERYEDPYVGALIDGNFRAFITRALSHYDTDRCPVGVVGGWGYACRGIFERLCGEAGIKTGRFEPEPISGLVKFHAQD